MNSSALSFRWLKLYLLISKTRHHTTSFLLLSFLDLSWRESQGGNSKIWSTVDSVSRNSSIWTPLRPSSLVWCDAPWSSRTLSSSSMFWPWFELISTSNRSKQMLAWTSSCKGQEHWKPWNEWKDWNAKKNFYSSSVKWSWSEWSFQFQ